MKRGLKAGLLVAVLVVVGAVAPVFAAGSKVTVGDLLKDIANLKRLPATDAVTAEAALRAAGYRLPALDRAATLTEGAVATISNAVGLQVASSNPTAEFSRGQMNSYVSAMGTDLSRTNRDSANPQTTSRSDIRSDSDSRSGKGNKRPHSKSPKKPKKPHKPKKPRGGHHRPGGWGHGRGR
jgi:hypothetical protein